MKFKRRRLCFVTERGDTPWTAVGVLMNRINWFAAYGTLPTLETVRKSILPSSPWQLRTTLPFDCKFETTTPHHSQYHVSWDAVLIWSRISVWWKQHTTLSFLLNTLQFPFGSCWHLYTSKSPPVLVSSRCLSSGQKHACLKAQVILGQQANVT